MSNLSPENDDIRFQPVLAIFCMKNSYGLKFDRRPFFKLFSQVLSEIKFRRCKLTLLTQRQRQPPLRHRSVQPNNLSDDLQLNLFILFEN